MLEPLFKLRPQRVVVILYHIICSVVVGSLAILIHDPQIYISLNGFQLIVISISITAPITAAIYLPILYLLLSSVDTDPTDAKTKQSELAALLASTVTLLMYVSVSCFHLLVDWWDEITSVMSIAWTVLIVIGILIIGQAIRHYHEYKQKKK